MSIIAVRNIPVRVTMPAFVKTLVNAVRGEFEALDFSNVKKGFKICYVKLSERLDPVQVIETINSKTKFTAYVPNTLPNLPPASKKGKIPLKTRLRLKIPQTQRPDRVMIETHTEILTELQTKYTGLFNLSKKTQHKLMEAIARTIFERLKELSETNPEEMDTGFQLSKLYRKCHPHFGDFQLILSTLHRLQDAAGVPRLQVHEAELKAVSAQPYSIDNIPLDKIKSASNKYSERIVKKITEHVSNMNTEMSNEDSVEEAARKKVREQLKKLSPYLPEIVKQVIGNHFIPQKAPYHRVRKMDGEETASEDSKSEEGDEEDCIIVDELAREEERTITDRDSNTINDSVILMNNEPEVIVIESDDDSNSPGEDNNTDQSFSNKDLVITVEDDELQVNKGGNTAPILIPNMASRKRKNLSQSGKERYRYWLQYLSPIYKIQESTATQATPITVSPLSTNVANEEPKTPNTDVIETVHPINTIKKPRLNELIGQTTGEIDKGDSSLVRDGLTDGELRMNAYSQSRVVVNPFALEVLNPHTDTNISTCTDTVNDSVFIVNDKESEVIIIDDDSISPFEENDTDRLSPNRSQKSASVRSLSTLVTEFFARRMANKRPRSDSPDDRPNKIAKIDATTPNPTLVSLPNTEKMSRPISDIQVKSKKKRKRPKRSKQATVAALDQTRVGIVDAHRPMSAGEVALLKRPRSESLQDRSNKIEMIEVTTPDGTIAGPSSTEKMQSFLQNFPQKRAKSRSESPQNKLNKIAREEITIPNTKLGCPNPSGTEMPRPMNSTQVKPINVKKPNVGKERPKNSEITKGLVRVGIVDANRPMSWDEMELVKEAILKSINACRRAKGPKFLGYTFKAGWLLVSCANNASKDWLGNLLKTLQPWHGASLYLISKKHFPKPVIATAWIPDPKIGAKTLIHRLDAQNGDVGCGHWMVYYRKIQSNGQTVSFALHPASLQVLWQKDFKLFFNFKTINLKIQYKKYYYKKSKLLKRIEKENVDGLKAEPSRTNVDGVKVEPSSTNVDDVKVEPSCTNVDGVKVEPSCTNVDGVKVEPSCTNVDGVKVEPSS